MVVPSVVRLLFGSLFSDLLPVRTCLNRNYVQGCFISVKFLRS